MERGERAVVTTTTKPITSTKPVGRHGDGMTTARLKNNNQPTMVGWLNAVGNRGVGRRRREREKMTGGEERIKLTIN
jgi:hypothetical protein